MKRKIKIFIAVLIFAGCASSPMKKEPANTNGTNINNTGNYSTQTKGKNIQGTQKNSEKKGLQKYFSKYELKLKTIKYKNDKIFMVDIGSVVHFDTDKYNIKQKYKPFLNKLISKLKDYNQTVLIVGHTDSVGSDIYNQALSEMRAREVYQYFISHGYPKNKLDYIGYGEEQPIATNATPEGRAKNRRVEIYIDGNLSVIYDYLKNRKINTKWLNNQNSINAGHVTKTIKGWTKHLTDYQIQKRLVKLSKPQRESVKINIPQRQIYINLKKRELKDN